MVGDLKALQKRFAEARERQKVAESAIDLVDDLVRALAGLGIEVDLKVGDEELPTASVSLKFSVWNGAGPPPSCLPSENDSAMSNDSARKWRDDELESAKRMRAEGKTVKQISEALNRPMHGVKSKLHEVAPSKQPPRWSAEEIATAKRMLRDGAKSTDIAAAVGRPVPATKFKLRTLRREVAEEDSAKAVETQVDRGSPAMLAQATSEAEGLTERQIDARLDAIGYPDGWDADLDLEMVELLAGGTSAGDAATILETFKSDIVDRFRTLCPNATIDEQQKLLAVLRRRAKKDT